MKSVFVLAAGVWVFGGVWAMGQAERPKAFETSHIVLYQADNILRQRAPNLKELAAYIARLQAVCAAFFAKAKTGESLDIVVAVRPGRRQRAWFVSTQRPGNSKDLEPLRKMLEEVEGFDAHLGPVAFAISARIAGGDAKAPGDGGQQKPPIPEEWRDAVKALKPPVQFPDGFLDAAWPGE